MTNEVKKLKELIEGTDNIVFFGGAGVSTESGIPDFRSTDGLYHQEWKYPPEVILSHTFYESNPAEFFRFYRAKMLAPDAKPNAAHLKLPVSFFIVINVVEHGQCISENIIVFTAVSQVQPFCKKTSFISETLSIPTIVPFAK